MDDGASFIKDFYFDLYMRMYNNFEPNTHYSTESSKIINKSYLEYCYKKTFLHIVKIFLNEKYPGINF